jgi:beta-barrel assembly-enhancing protease
VRRLITLALILALAAAALYLAQHRRHPDSVSPNAVLDAAAGLQRDVSRLPLQLTRLSDAEETRIGDALAQGYGTDPAFLAQAQAMQSYVSEVGARLAAHARRRLNYRFHLVPDLINAFAMPGGHVFIGQGLIRKIKSEDALAFVLGHEIEHIDHYHAAERVQIEAQLHDLDLGALAALADIPVALWQAGYSKDLEFEADREGLRLAVAAGYSPEGAAEVLRLFLQLEREYVIHSATPGEELGEVAIQGLFGYFRSHPNPSERLAQAQRVITDDHLPSGRPLTPLRNTAAPPTAVRSPP